MKILLIMTTITTMMFLMMKHPLSMGIILLIQSTLIALITGNEINNFWFSYIMFLIMVGGMLVLFIYMTSIASNEKFKMSNKMIMYSSIAMIISVSMMFSLSKLMMSDKLMPNLNNTNMNMMKFINFPNNIIMFIMIIYLLFTLIAVVKITMMKHGPLRQKF
uniref:NADH-ubiquinone oxidoreductase chain 6 n=1 Tax=Abraeinae sp. MJTNT-2012 TaxID=1227474 RepID=S4SUG7_9COLE|nr:NADH dehydrogenase subunit 6 [Abraeinae sp. MJTNT-2012]